MFCYEFIGEATSARVERTRAERRATLYFREEPFLPDIHRSPRWRCSWRQIFLHLAENDQLFSQALKRDDCTVLIVALCCPLLLTRVSGFSYFFKSTSIETVLLLVMSTNLNQH
jgi:hypothetical protein